MNGHYHCWWCGHVIAPECGFASVSSSDEPDRQLCHGETHDCYSAALQAREAKALGENVRKLVEFQI